MKKIVVFLTVLVLLIPVSLFGSRLRTASTSSPFPDVSVDAVAHTQQIAYPLDTHEVVVNIQNFGDDFALFYPLDILLERQVNDQWHTVPSAVEPDHSVTQSVGAGAPATPITVTLANYTQPLEAGTYRLVLHHGENALFATAEFSLGLAPTENSNQVPWQSDDQYAVVYVGYRTITDWEVTSKQYQEELALPCIFDQYEMGGDECFLIIPRYRETALSLYPLDINDIETEKEPVPQYTQRGGRPFLVFCNQSDIFSNVRIDFFVNQETFCFSPQLSGMDGRLVPVDRGQDLTIYPS